jgi:two-component system CheB/CheR fusion protein
VLVEGDHTRLSQVLGNLLSNSTKFTDQGGRISLTLSFDRAAEQAVLRVADNGIGMDPGLIPLLFQPFSQGATSLARTNGGLGLGLALVKALVELHHGTVEARSDGPGKGSEFVVRLPLLRVEATPINRHKETPGGQRLRRVLLIEDNLDAAHSLREMIQLDGHAVKVAHSGLDGLELARSFQPDLVLCDIGLPTLDGYELARKFREDPVLQSTFLVALTGYAAHNDRERAASAGFDLHLAKPISPDRLAEILSQVAQGRRTAAKA